MSSENFSLKPVPLNERKGAVALTFVMLGLTFFSASMWTGGTLGTSLTYNDFWLAVILGNLMLGIYTSFLGYIGAKTGLTTHILARYSFGIRGSWLPSLLLGGTQVGWFGVGVAMFAIPVNKVTGIDVNYLILGSGLLMTITVFFGISALTILSTIAVPAIAVLGSYSVYLAVTNAGGLDVLEHIVPKESISLSMAITLVVGSFISAGSLTADFVRFGRKAKQAIIISMIAFFLGNSLMFIFGAAGAAGQRSRAADREGPLLRGRWGAPAGNTGRIRRLGRRCGGRIYRSPAGRKTGPDASAGGQNPDCTGVPGGF